jgi:hypothetical protein
VMGDGIAVVDVTGETADGRNGIAVVEVAGETAGGRNGGRLAGDRCGDM